MRKYIIIVFAVLVVGSYAAVSGFEFNSSSSGSVQDNFGENWSR